MTAKDLREIAKYSIKHFEIQQATLYRRALQATLELLAEHPVVGRELSDVAPGLLRHPYQSHCIYYRQTSDHVLILRILHTSQDPTRCLVLLNPQNH